MNVTSASPAVDLGPAGEPEAGVVPRPLSRLSDADLGTLLMIRHFELAVLELFSQGRLHGTTHTCLGQEYIPVALYPLLDEGDYVFSNHRGHGHYLARFHDPHGLLAEIMGRAGAVCHGVGGSQHIYRDRYLSTGVQGQSLPVAVGVGLHLKQAEPGRIAVVHIGDGTWGEGAVYEALNMAQLWQVPVLVVVEHNGIAQSTPTERQMSGTVAALDRGQHGAAVVLVVLGSAAGARRHRDARHQRLGQRTVHRRGPADVLGVRPHLGGDRYTEVGGGHVHRREPDVIGARERVVGPRLGPGDRKSVV